MLDKFARHVVLVSCFIGASQISVSAVDVPDGGNTVKVGSGGSTVKVTVKNTAKESRKDITISVFQQNEGGGAVPDITGINIVGESTDQVDDDMDGMIDAGTPEDNQSDDDGTTTTVLRSIMTGSASWGKGSSKSVEITFSGNTPEGAALRIKLSKKGEDDKHYDVLQHQRTGPLGEGQALVSIGSPRVAVTIQNLCIDPINTLQIVGTSTNQFLSIALESPFQSSGISHDGVTATIDFVPPLATKEFANFLIVLTGDVTEPNGEFDLVFSSIDPAECEVDIPTVSEWGLVALTLVLLTAGTIVLRRRAVAS